MKPSVGRICHYVPFGTPIRPDGTQAYASNVCRAAIVAEVHDMADLGVVGNVSPETRESLPNQPVTLVVLNPTGIFFHEVEYDEDHGPATWHWPERVEE
jgi:hypothetical protein